MPSKPFELPSVGKEEKRDSASVSTMHESHSESYENNRDASVDNRPLTTPTSKNDPDPAEAQYNPGSPAFWLVIASAYLSFFLVALDRSIIATAIPAITNTFNSIEDIGWYGSAYMLTCAIFNPLFGKVYQLYDTKRTFLVSIVIFEVGSALCGAAPSSLILSSHHRTRHCWNRSSGHWMWSHHDHSFSGSSSQKANIHLIFRPCVWRVIGVGPSNRWLVHGLPVPAIGAFALVCALVLLHLPAARKEKMPIIAQIKSLDPLGLLFFIPSMVCLILALQWGGTTYPWSAPKVIGLLVTFAVTFLAFLAVEWKMPDTALAPPRIVLNRSVGGSMIFVFFLGGGMMSAVYYLSIWFQAAQGQSAMEAGIRTIPMVLSLVLFGILNAVFTQKIGYYVPAMLASPVIASVAAGLLSTLTPGVGSAKWIGYQILYGVGLGFGAQTANLAVQTVLVRKDVAIGTAMMFFMQQLGGSVFLAVGQNIFSRQLVKELSGIAELDTKAIVNTGVTDLRKVVPANEIDTVINAYSYSLTRVFILSAAVGATMILGSLMLEWRSIKKGEAPKASEADVEDGKSKLAE